MDLCSPFWCIGIDSIFGALWRSMLNEPDWINRFITACYISQHCRSSVSFSFKFSQFSPFAYQPAIMSSKPVCQNCHYRMMQSLAIQINVCGNVVVILYSQHHRVISFDFIQLCMMRRCLCDVLCLFDQIFALSFPCFVTDM